MFENNKAVQNKIFVYLAFKYKFRLVCETGKTFRQVLLVWFKLFSDLSSIRIQLVEKFLHVTTIDVSLTFDVADQFANFAAVARREKNLLLLTHLDWKISSILNYSKQKRILECGRKFVCPSSICHNPSLQSRIKLTDN